VCLDIAKHHSSIRARHDRHDKRNMPPASSQKGTGKKGGAAAVRQQPRSRNTTPSSLPPAASLPPIETQETETIDLRFDVFRNLTYEDLVDSGASTAIIPDSRALDGIVTRLQRLGESIEKRGNYCDRGMRLLAANRRTRMDEMAAEGRREDERRQREAEDEERERKANKKKRKATENLASSGSNAGQSIHFHLAGLFFTHLSPRLLLWLLPRNNHSLSCFTC
jgi:transcriptional adapter 3